MFNQIIGSFVKGRVDRPIGSIHPSYPNTIYPINYGYIESITTDDGGITEGVIAGDGEAQDAYILGTDKVVEEFEGCGYGVLKEAVGCAVNDILRPLHGRIAELEKDKAYVDSVIKNNAEKAQYFSTKTLRKVQKKVGFPERPR